jgi:hypothetical protein
MAAAIAGGLKMDNEEFYIPKLPTETPKSHSAKRDYILLGAGRSLDKLHKMYLDRKQTKTGYVPTVQASTIRHWSSKFGWVELAAEYDDFLSDRLFQEQLEARQNQYREELNEFARLHKNLGKGSFKTAADTVKELIKFTEQNPTINDWDTAQKAANLCRVVLPIADLWARSLCIEKILSRDLSE